MPPDQYIAFDLETTGLSPVEDRIIEIGAVRFEADGSVVARFERLVNPLRTSGSSALAVHGISDEALSGADIAERILPGFVEFLGDPTSTTLMAHNAIFDAGFLGRELVRSGLPIPAHWVLDTLSLARSCWPAQGSHKLGHLADRLGLDPEGSHRALADADRVRGLWMAIEASGLAQAIPPIAYPIFDGTKPSPPPRGWAEVVSAIEQERSIRIEYRGGTRGPAPRDVSPLGFSNRGGVAYLVARCHHDDREKQFRIDRVRRFDVIDRV